MFKTLGKRSAIYKLAIVDYVMSVLALVLFHYANQSIGVHIDYPSLNKDSGLFNWFLVFGIIPLYWLFVYLEAGTYFDLYRKSRLNEVNRTLLSCLIGGLLLATLLWANKESEIAWFIKLGGRYLIIHTSLTLIGRIVSLNKVKRNMGKGHVTYNTLIVGSNDAAIELLNEIRNNKHLIGHKLIGYIQLPNEENKIDNQLPYLGQLDDLEQIVAEKDIEEILLAVHSSEHRLIEQILIRLSYIPVVVKFMPDMYDFISGTVKTSNVYDTALITMDPNPIPEWQRVVKRTFDIVAASIALILLLPIYIIAAIKVRLSSKGPILYKQQRIGLFGTPFYIYKFRSMYVDSEVNGPALSSKDDPRITPWGKIMRKWRIDELPQFFNILIGDMSLVGPRPERKHFIDVICQSHPHYKFLHKVQPGLTSWGMVKYGYAENVEQMIQRMRYDLLYIKNVSLLLDVKIMLHTLVVLFQGRGK